MSTTAPSSLVISAKLKDYINRELINFKINVSQFKLKHCILLKMSIILDGHKQVVLRKCYEDGQIDPPPLHSNLVSINECHLKQMREFTQTPSVVRKMKKYSEK